MVTSTARGMSMIKFNTAIETSLRVIAIPPDSTKGYYSKIIKIKPASVLEVTLLLLPFPQFLHL